MNLRRKAQFRIDAGIGILIAVSILAGFTHVREATRTPHTTLAPAWRLYRVAP